MFDMSHLSRVKIKRPFDNNKKTDWWRAWSKRVTGRVGKKTFWFVSQVQFLPSRFGLSDVRTGLKCVSLWFQTSTWYENSAARVSPSLFRLIADLTTNYLRHVISLEFQVSVQKIYKNSANLWFFFRQNITETSWPPGQWIIAIYHWSLQSRPRLVVHVPRQQMHQHLT